LFGGGCILLRQGENLRDAIEFRSTDGEPERSVQFPGAINDLERSFVLVVFFVVNLPYDLKLADDQIMYQQGERKKNWFIIGESLIIAEVGSGRKGLTDETSVLFMNNLLRRLVPHESWICFIFTGMSVLSLCLVIVGFIGMLGASFLRMT
jgi:hypothetical protein